MTSDFQTMFDGAQGTSWTRIILHRRHACYDVNCGSRDSMRSAERGDPTVPRTQLQLGKRSFAVASSTS